MTDRYSPSDRHIYGAEDDEEMDMILDYLDKANAEQPTNAPTPPRT